MNTAIIIVAALTALMGLATWRMARDATSDGDYSFVVPGVGGTALMIVLLILVLIRFW